MSDLYKDIFVGIMFLTGVFGFVSGEFIISSTLFAMATLASNVYSTERFYKAKKI